jgi:hypothetical protein
LAAFWVAGCGIFDPDPCDDCGPPPPPAYPVLELPSRVLLALDIAYENRDSVKYKDLYDSTYTGRSTDLNASDGGTIDLTYEDEVSHIRGLVLEPGISNVLFDLGAENTWDRLASDDPSHPEWAVIQITGSAYRIEVTKGEETLQAKGEAGTFLEFAFKPTLDLSSPTDTLWKIVRWREVGNSTPPPQSGPP